MVLAASEQTIRNHIPSSSLSHYIEQTAEDNEVAAVIKDTGNNDEDNVDQSDVVIVDLTTLPGEQ